jgi:hypothetical protein
LQPQEGTMADARRGIGTHREGRQERTEQPKQAGATGRGRKEKPTPKEAREETLHHRGKTRKHVSDDR